MARPSDACPSRSADAQLIRPSYAARPSAFLSVARESMPGSRPALSFVSLPASCLIAISGTRFSDAVLPQAEVQGNQTNSSSAYRKTPCVALLAFSREWLAIYSAISVWWGIWTALDADDSPFPNTALRAMCLSIVGVWMLVCTDLLFSAAQLGGSLGCWDTMEMKPGCLGHSIRGFRTVLAVLSQICMFLGFYDGLDCFVFESTYTRDICYSSIGILIGTLLPLLVDHNCLPLFVQFPLAVIILALQNAGLIGIWNIITVWMIKGDTDVYMVYLIVGIILLCVRLVESEYKEKETLLRKFSRFCIRVIASVGDSLHFIGFYSLLDVACENVNPGITASMSALAVGFLILAASGTLWNVAAGQL